MNMETKGRVCLMTNDVETTSIVNGGLRSDAGQLVIREGLPRLLSLYEKYEVKATFFFIADFAKRSPEIVKMVQSKGHEVACHGLTHEYDKAFDIMPFKMQLDHMTSAKKILEDIAGEEVVSFRAPALRVNKETPLALVESGFNYDSSVAPQRMDMFMSLGSGKKLQWLGAPRTPYEASIENLARKGKSGIIEVPVSSYVLPYIGTFMRISPVMTKMVRHFLYWETRDTNKVVNFLVHPNEVMNEIDFHLKTERRSSNYISFLLSDVIRHKLKQKNLGLPALALFEDQIKYWKERNYSFQTISQTISITKDGN